jgi:uncharacterized membrane protein YfcA
MHLFIFALVNFAAAMLSGAAGGGGGLISIPTLLLLGLNPASAVATGKFGGLGISAGTSIRFAKEKITDRHTVIIFSILSGIGAIIGSLLLVKYQNHEKALENIVGYSILLVGVPMLYVRNLGLEPKERSRPIKLFGGLLLAAAVVLQAALGSGLGSLQLVVLMGCFGMTALVASATRRAMQLTVAIISLSIFIVSNIVDYKFGLIGLITSFVGGYCGAHVAIKRGNRFVVNLFAVTSILLALQLLLH